MSRCQNIARFERIGDQSGVFGTTIVSNKKSCLHIFVENLDTYMFFHRMCFCRFRDEEHARFTRRKR